MKDERKIIKSGLTKFSCKTRLCYWLLTLIHSHILNSFNLRIYSSGRSRLSFFQTAPVLRLAMTGQRGWLTAPLFSPLHLSSAGCHSWALQVPRPGAGLWRRAAWRYPRGGNECHHDVSRKYTLSFSNISLKLKTPRKHSSSTLTVPACEKCWSRSPLQNTSRHCEYLSLPRDEWITYLKPELKVSLRWEWQWLMDTKPICWM